MFYHGDHGGHGGKLLFSVTSVLYSLRDLRGKIFAGTANPFVELVVKSV